MKKEFKTLDEFYLFYLSQHKNKTSQYLHVCGTLGGLIIFILSLYLRNPYFLILAFIYGYGLAWIGHFFFEKNTPATIKYPFYSFICDWKMIKDILFRRI